MKAQFVLKSDNYIFNGSLEAQYLEVKKNSAHSLDKVDVDPDTSQDRRFMSVLQPCLAQFPPTQSSQDNYLHVPMNERSMA